MSDRAYENALKRQEALERELKDIRKFIQLYQRFAGTEAEQIPGPDLLSGPVQHVGPKFNTKLQTENRPRRNLPRNEIAKMARNIIIQHGKPMTRGQLVTAFDEIGSPIGGQNPSKNMGTVMWRLRDVFVNIEGYGYWPTDTPNPRYSYTPESRS